MIDQRLFASALSVAERQTERLEAHAVSELAREVVRRLAEHPRRAMLAEHHATSAEIDTLVAALLSDRHAAAADMLTGLQADGVPISEVYIGYITGAARRLGKMWDDDEVGFLQVTLATSRLTAIICGLKKIFYDREGGTSRRAMFAACPGESHVMGVSMAADLFRREGWEIDLEIGQDHEDLLMAQHLGGYPVVGLSASSGAMIMPLARVIRAMRLLTPGALIYVAGEITHLHPDIAETVGADGVLTDPVTAMQQITQALAAAH
ncbi:MAG: B12-binding domain-containing protein [Rhodobacterales bacterium]